MGRWMWNLIHVPTHNFIPSDEEFLYASLDAVNQPRMQY